MQENYHQEKFGLTFKTVNFSSFKTVNITVYGMAFLL